MVALHGDTIVSVDVAHAIGHLKSVNPNGEIVRTARAVGIVIWRLRAEREPERHCKTRKNFFLACIAASRYFRNLP